MVKIGKANIGLLGLTLELYRSIEGLYEELSAFAEELSGNLSDISEVSFPGICYTREQIDRAIEHFEKQNVDMILVVLLSYSPSLLAVPGLLKTRLPILIWNTQKLFEIPETILAWETTKNHGMHGVQDLTNVLNRIGKRYDLVTGHYLDPDTRAEIKRFVEAARVTNWMKKARIGLIGYPMQGMGDFALDETAFLSQVGAQVQHVAMRDVQNRAQKVSAAMIHEQWVKDQAAFAIDQTITEDIYQASERLVFALKEIIEEYSLVGFASHFMAVEEEGILDTLPFLASSKMLAEGYGFGGEGDVTSAVMVAMMVQLAGYASFTEMFTMDFADNSILMMHMGEANYKIARKDEPVRMLRSALGLVQVRVEPVLLAFGYAPGEVTLASLMTSVDGKLKIVATEGSVVDFRYAGDLGRPHGKFRPTTGLNEFLTGYSKEGGSHHLALGYGHYARTLEIMAGLAGIEFVKI